MTRKNRQRIPPFFKWTGGLQYADVIVGVSLDRMLRVAVKRIPEEFADYGEKITAIRVEIPHNGRGHFSAVLEDGTAVPPFFGIVEPALPEITSGSSGNIAFGLRQLGVERVGVIGAVGNDIDGGKLIADLDADNVEYGLVQADKTSFTVRLREESTGRILMLCQKGKYVLSGEVSSYVAGLYPRLLTLTSLRPADFGFAEDLVRRLRAHRHHGKKGQGNGPFISLVPHPTLLSALHLRERVRRFFGELDLLTMNAHEAGLWLAGETPAPDPLRHLGSSGAAIAVVTKDAGGAAVVSGDTVRDFPPFHTKVVEPAGAGDAFHAVLLCWQHQRPLCQGNRLAHAVREANFVASQKVGSHGPWALPSRQRIQNFRRYGAS